MVAVLNPVKGVHRHDLHRLAPCLGPVAEPLLERLLGAAGDHVQQPCRPAAIADAGQVDDHGDVLVPATGVSPHVLVDPEDLDAVEPVGVLDEDTLAFGQDRVVRGVPGDPETLGRPGPRSGAGTRSLPAPTAARGVRASPAAARPGWCLGATRARSRCTGSGGL